jgi:HK97 family phage major capsid protein/HK97 family phage prohead protease
MASEKRTRPMTFSSEATVVQRWFGGEQLDHSAGAVRMDFLKSGRAPLLLSHDMRQQIGVIDEASIQSDKKGHGVVRFGRSSNATDALANVDDQILVNTSVGYRVHEMQLVSTKDGEPTYRIVDWEPYEVSLVAVPADPVVGMGRASEVATVVSEPERNVPPVVSQPTPQTGNAGVIRMSEATAAAAAATVVPPTAIEAENERRQAIIKLCKANRIDPRVEARWIEQGTTLATISGEILDVMEERGKAKPGTATELGLSKSETQRFSIVRALRALHTGHKNPKLMQDAAFELECSQAVAKALGRELSSSILVPAEILMRPLGASAARAMATTPGSKGGYLVNVENMGFIDILRNRSVALRMGARQLSGLTGNVMFPRQTGKVSVTWQAGEGTSTSAADQALGQLSMTPKTCIAITDVSEQLLRQSSISAEQFIMADLAADVAIDGVDAAVINGTGGAQPIGIKNTAGITSGQDAASATYAKILAFVSTAGAANAIRGNPGFVTNTAGAAKLMTVQRFTSTDTPVWEGNMLDGTLVQFNAMSSEQIGSGGLLFGSWDEVIIGDWGVLELSTDNGGTRFNQAQVGIRALWMVDVMLRYPQAFVSSTNLS